MATPSDVAHAFALISHSIAKQVDETPTGVIPGYNAALAGAVLPNGKLRYVTPPGFTGWSVTRSGSDQTISNASDTILTWTAQTLDHGDYYDSGVSTSRITVPAGKAGVYLLIAHIKWQANATGDRRAEILINGVGSVGFDYRRAANGITYNTIFALYPFASATYYFEVRVHQTSGGSLDVQSGTSFDGMYLGPLN